MWRRNAAREAELEGSIAAREQAVVEGALRSGRQAGGSPCWHGFVVPHDRVVLDAVGGLVTREASTPLSTGGRAWDAARGEAVRAWRACKRISL